MARTDEVEVRVRIVIEHPVPGVLHSLQGKEGGPLDPRRSKSGEPLTFEFRLRIAPGPKFFGDQVRREGKLRRFVYVRIGTSAGDHFSPWGRRMKVDIHDIDPKLLALAAKGGVLTATINGTAKDGGPACATIRPVNWSIG